MPRSCGRWPAEWKCNRFDPGSRTGRCRSGCGDAVHFRDRCAHHGGNDVLRDIDAALFILASNIIFRHRKIPPDKIVQYSVPRAAAKRKKNVSRPAKRCTPQYLQGASGKLYYFFTFLQNSIRIVATCSRVALPCGSRQVWPPLLAPEIRPSATASAIAFFAQSDTLPASG